jgi:hypothetical protein
MKYIPRPGTIDNIAQTQPMPPSPPDISPYDPRPVGPPPPPPRWIVPWQLISRPKMAPQKKQSKEGCGCLSCITGCMVSLLFVCLIAGIMVTALVVTGSQLLGQVFSSLSSYSATSTPVSTTQTRTIVSPTSTSKKPTVTPSPIATTTPVVPSGFTFYQSSSGKWNISIPKGAEITSGKSQIGTITASITRFSFDAHLSLSVYDISAVFGSASIPQLFIANLEQDGAENIVVKQSPKNVVHGDYIWQESLLTGTINNEQYQVIIDYLAYDNNNQSKAIVSVAPNENAKSAKDTYFSPMLTTFHILS